MKQLPSIPPLSLLLATARETVVVAGELIREKRGQPLSVRDKGFRDLVTNADLAAQKLITDTISGRFPDHGFLAEEADPGLPATGPVIWIIDPIDGTTNYSRQHPIFCVSIAAAVPVDSKQWAVDGSGADIVAGYQVLAGAIYDPMQDELFSAAAGQGATLASAHGQQQPLRVSPGNDLIRTVIGLDWSHHQRLRQSSLDALQHFAHDVHTIRAIGSAALAMAWVAAGRLDGYLNYSLQPWDVAAAGLVLQEAGGQLSDSLGHSLGRPASAGSCVATNGHIHDAFLQSLAPGKSE